MTVAQSAQPAQTAAARPASGWVWCCPGQTRNGIPSRAVPWFRVAVGLFVAAQTMLLGLTVNLTPPDDRTTLLLLQGGMAAATLVVMLLLGLPLAIEVVRQMARWRLTMELLFLAGITAALGISIQSMWVGHGPVYFEVVNVLLVVYSLGRAINTHSRRRALASLQTSADPPATARRVDAEGDGEQRVKVAAVQVGDRVRVFPGETIPVDGMIERGEAMVRQTPFTGQWTSTVRRPGDAVVAGTACEDGTLLIRATVPGTQRRVDRLGALIEQACTSPTSLQRQADRFVGWFLPAVALLAGATFTYWASRDTWHTGLFNALAVLLVACPCAAGLATPLAVWSALGQLAARGLVLRGGDAVERLADIDGVIFDKTGTLSEDAPVLRQIVTSDDPGTRRPVLAMIAAIEQRSTHPVAKALRGLSAVPQAPAVQVLALRVLPGRGIEADVQCPAIGEPDKAHVVRIERDQGGPSSSGGLLTLTVTIDGRWAATATLAEHLRDSAPPAIAALQAMGLAVRVMTGDPAPGLLDASLPGAAASLTPEQKHDLVLRLRENRQEQFRRPLFVGDGLNDAAAMAASHASIALASGAEIAVQTALATLHVPDLTVVAEAIALSRRTVHAVRSNLRWAIAYNAAGIFAAAAGYLHPILAALLMAGSSALVAWRSFRLTASPKVAAPLAVPVGSVRPPPKTRTYGAALSAAVRAICGGAEDGPQTSRGRALRQREVSWAAGLRTLRCYALVHWLGIMGQGAVLARLANLSVGQTVLLLLVMILPACVLSRIRRLPTWADMTLAMVCVGGLGMNLGWWFDQGFGPAVRLGSVMSCCSGGAAHPVGSASHWMYWGMLLLGVPAMYLLRRTPEVFSLRRWCCLGPLVAGIPAMCFGMWAGAQLAAHLPMPSPSAQVLASYLFMMLGMCAGMAVPHAIAASPRQRAVEQENR